MGLGRKDSSRSRLRESGTSQAVVRTLSTGIRLHGFSDSITYEIVITKST